MRGVRACGTHARAKQSGASNDRRPRARGGRDQREADGARGAAEATPRPLRCGAVRTAGRGLRGSLRAYYQQYERVKAISNRHKLVQIPIA